MELDDALNKWCAQMRRERLKDRTIHFYRESMHAVAAIMEANKRPFMPEEVRPSDVSFLLDWLESNDYAVQTRRGYVSALRRWCKWGGNRNMHRWPKPRFPADKRPNVDWLTPQQAEKLLSWNLTPLQRAVINLELRQGLRHVEVIRLKLSDVNRDNRLIKVTGKGGIRLIPLVPETEAALSDWFRIREGWAREGRERYPSTFSDPGNLIVWRRAGKLSTYSEEGYGLDKVVSLKISKEIGFRFSNHTLRRTFGRALYRAGVPVATISAILGHDSTEVTLRYIGIDIDDMREAMKINLFHSETTT